MADPTNGVPLDADTPVGQVRLVIGDDVPDAAGNYLFSDEAIEVALSLAGDKITRTVATLVKQLALQQIMLGQSIKADDFAINTTSRGADLLKVADSYTKQADAEDAAAEALASSGEVVIVNTRLRRVRDSYTLPMGLTGLLNCPV